MLSPFQPAGEILGPGCQVRSVVIADDPFLPSGEYTFIDTYCTDKTCDCRKTILQIFHEEKLVSIVSFGWESPSYYQRWLRSPELHEMAKEMSGVSIDFSSPDLVSPKGILLLVKFLLDEKWISVFKENYRRIRESFKPKPIVRSVEKISRNALCSCGSGKKYKHCCL